MAPFLSLLPLETTDHVRISSVHSIEPSICHAQDVLTCLFYIISVPDFVVKSLSLGSHARKELDGTVVFTALAIAVFRERLWVCTWMWCAHVLHGCVR